MAIILDTAHRLEFFFFKHGVLETGSVPVIRWNRKDSYPTEPVHKTTDSMFRRTVMFTAVHLRQKHLDPLACTRSSARHCISKLPTQRLSAVPTVVDCPVKFESLSGHGSTFQDSIS